MQEKAFESYLFLIVTLKLQALDKFMKKPDGRQNPCSESQSGDTRFMLLSLVAEFVSGV